MLIKKLVEDNQPSEQNITAYVSHVIDNKVSAIDNMSIVNIPMLSIPGIKYSPAQKSNILAIPSEGEYICLGEIIQQHSEKLEQGELLLQSAGGAYIKLCNNGDVVINSLTINKNGKILSK